MRKMYTTKRLLGAAACAAAIFVAAPATAQDGSEVVQEQELFDSDNANKDGNKVNVGETGEIDLHVKELEITKVLQLLSIQSQRNIIASRGVENAKVSADLYGVSFEDALKAILEPNGFGYVEEGNFIYVLTKSELEERENHNRKLNTKIVRLNYLRADEAAGFVTPMLSDNGSITASGNVEDGIDPTLDDAGADGYSGPPTLVIRDYEDSVDSITEVISELDVQPKQVIIEATVLRATLTEKNQFGVDFSLFTDLTGASPLDIIDPAIATGSPSSTSNFGALQSKVGDVAAQSGGVKLGFIAGDAAVFVSALDSVTDTTLIATPKVTVLDRNRTSILVGEKIAYLSTTVTETSETQTVEFLEVGTQLNVRPFVSNDGKVRLELRPSVSDATIRTIGSTSAPDESTVELVTNVIVESGQTIVLGGLFTDDNSVTRSQVPGLGEIPLLGAAFQGQNDTVGRSEVIFLVKATVDENNTLVKELGNEAMARVDVARLADREQLLPWSRSKLTAAHMVNARKYYDEAQSLNGEARDAKMADALYCVDMALHMNPSMVDALRLKEQITGEASYIKYEESIVTDTYDTVLNEEMKALGLSELPAAEPEAQDVEEAAEADALIEPETLGEAPAGFDAFGEPVGQAATETQTAEAEAAADAEWLEQIMAEEFGSTGEAPAQTEAAQSEATEVALEVEQVVEGEATEAEQAQATESEAGFEVKLEVEQAADAETEATEPKGEFDGEAEAAWRELTTAELLQQAAEATEQAIEEAETADAEPESDETQAAEAADTAEASDTDQADAQDIEQPEQVEEEADVADAEETNAETDNSTADVQTQTD